MANRALLYILLLLIPIAWGSLLLFARYVPPHTPLAFVVFFLILGVALTCTLSPIAYAIGGIFSPRRYRATMSHAMRQGVLLTLVIVLNLILRALDSWNIFMAIVILLAAIVVEVLSMAGK